MTAPGKAGHAAIWKEVIRQHGLVRTVLCRIGVPESDLDDLEQNCMFVAWRRIEAGGFCPLDPGKPLPVNVAAWLGGIARWIAIESREHPVDVDALNVSGPEERLIAKEELAAIDRLRMTLKQREVVRLTGEGYSAREIGERLGIPEDTASTYLKRARKAYQRAQTRQHK